MSFSWTQVGAILRKELLHPEEDLPEQEEINNVRNTDADA
jgi:hypothetical protein